MTSVFSLHLSILMFFLKSFQKINIEGNKRELLQETWTLCELVIPKMLHLKKGILEKKNEILDYEEYHRLKEDLAMISVFSVQMDHPNDFDWNRLAHQWMELRNIFVKYIGNEADPRILAMDRRYSKFYTLPDIVLDKPQNKCMPCERSNSNSHKEIPLESVDRDLWSKESKTQREGYGVISGI